MARRPEIPKEVREEARLHHAELVQEIKELAGWNFAAFAVLVALGWYADASWDRADDAVYAIRHVGLIFVSMLATWWMLVAALELFAITSFAVTLGEWLALQVRKRTGRPPKQTEDTPWWRIAHIIISRQLGHFWAFQTLVLVSLVYCSSFGGNVTWAALMLLGVPLGSRAIALKLVEDRSKTVKVTRGDLIWLRRWILPAATCVGVVFLLLQPGAFQHHELRNLGFVLMLGAGLRLWLWWGWFRRWCKALGEPTDPHAKFRERVRVRAGSLNGVITLVFVGVPLLPAVISAVGGGSAAEIGRQSRVDHWRPGPKCESWPKLADWDVPLFLVSDNQFRALHGRPSVGQVSLIEEVVPVALRPIELDLLSGATLNNFADRYQALSGIESRLPWAHLGDYGDLACRSEFDRLPRTIERFGPEGLAGIAPGNHDAFFTGNFAWHPEWSTSGACPKGPQYKHGDAGAHAGFEEAMAGVERGLVAKTVAGEDEFFTRVVKLGEVADREVLGVFLDTSDYGGFWLGVAGVVGDVSAAQAQWVIDALERHDRAFVVLLQHHPVDSLTNAGRRALVGLSDALGGRLVAVLSAHTHVSQHRHHAIGPNGLDEFIVGSTTDAPQEAALFGLRESGPKAIEIGFRAMPAVARDRLACDPGAIPAATCRAHMRALKAKKEGACDELFRPTRPENDPEPHDPLEALRGSQQRAAQALMNCIRVEGTPEVGADEPACGPPEEEPWDHGPLCDPKVDQTLEDLCVRPGAPKPNAECVEQLVCLSWAASVLQSHKDDGWTMADATELAFDRLSAYGAWTVTVPVVVP